MTNRTAALLACLLLATAHAAQALSPVPQDDAFQAACHARAAAARAAGQNVVRGEDGWIFLVSELRHLGVGPFWGEHAATASSAEREDARDPLPIIVDTARQLREAGIDLLLVPVPPKAVVYADRLGLAEGVPPRLDRHLQAFHTLLREQGMEVLDLTDTFLAARAQDETEGPVYLEQDTHWSSRGSRLAADAIARHWAERPWLPARDATPVLREETVEITGDLWTLLGDRDLPRTPARLLRVEVDGAPLADNPASPILLLADSHGLVFHIGGDMHALGAGLADHLALAWGAPVDLMARRGSAATSIRIDLARRFRAEPALAQQKQAVIWCFAARDFTESTGWRPIPLLPPR